MFRTLLGELNLLAQIPVPVHMGEPGDTEKDTAYVHEDNSSAVIIVRDRLYGARTKFYTSNFRGFSGDHVCSHRVHGRGNTSLSGGVQ